MNKNAGNQSEREEPPSLGGDIWSDFKAESRSSMRWAAWGAGVGGIVLGAVGFWFFGAAGLAIGAAVGAVAGGLGAWFFYLNI